MRKFQKCISAFVLAAVLICSLPVASQAADILPLWDNTNMLQIALSFSDDVATCSAYISGKSDTSRITGSLQLWDVTTNTKVETWHTENKDTYLHMSEKADVTPGHTYKLTLIAYVYNKQGSSEYLKDTTTKKN